MAGCHHGKSRVHTLVKRLLRDRSGATVVEYGMLIALLSVVIIVGMQNFSNQIINTWLIVTTYTNNAQANEQ
jgi:pilus assembly protein Flp/PilA